MAFKSVFEMCESSTIVVCILYTHVVFTLCFQLTVSNPKPFYKPSPIHGRCPYKTINGIRMVKYGNPPKCFTVGQQGPCGNLEILMQEHSFSSTGVCVCRCRSPQQLSLEILSGASSSFSCYKVFENKLYYQTYHKWTQTCETEELNNRLMNRFRSLTTMGHVNEVLLSRYCSPNQLYSVFSTCLSKGKIS